MPRVQAPFHRRVLAKLGLARDVDPLSGLPVGPLRLSEAIAAGRATMGRHSYGAPVLNYGPGDTAKVHIGAFCSIADGVEFIAGGNHRPDWVSTFPFRVAWNLPGAHTDGHPRPERDIEVGNDVWLGAGALILPGVQIGHGAVVGARAVVARDVRPYSIVVGSPAREVRRRFDDERVEALLRACWWDWSDEEIRRNVDLLTAPDVDALLQSGAGAP
jgi:acetyltransferase-like isoleucine patch superfamily enzyme